MKCRDGGEGQVVAVGAPAGPANGMSKSFQFNPGALAPVAVSLHRHGARFKTKRRGAREVGVQSEREGVSEWRKRWMDDEVRELSRGGTYICHWR